MIKDFFSKYPGETVCIPGPDEAMYKVLEKIGLVEKQGHKWVFMDWMSCTLSV